MSPAQNIVDILVAQKLIDEEQAKKINQEALATNRPVEELLKEKKLASDVDIAKARARILNIPFVTLATKGVSLEVLSLIPEAVARRYQVAPFSYDKLNDTISVAMTDPTNLEVIEFLQKKTGKKIKPYLATEEDIQITIDEGYSKGWTAEVTEAIKESVPEKVKTIEASRIGEVIREAPIARIVSTLLEYAIRSRASDIHIEPMETRVRVRYRIDGILYEKLVLPRHVHEAVVSRIKILAGMKIDERRAPQDGRFNFRLGNDEVDLRVSSLPISHGEKVVMRLLKKSGAVPTLPELGLRGAALRHLQENIAKPQGIILVTGPTGSGKTTTLYSVLTKLNTTAVNIVTLEDPVEYEIVGVNQVQVNPRAGLTFATGLRSFLRQDPDIILVGEIRDSETTSLAIQAALTGHLVFSTLHTNDAATAIPRLLDLKAEAFLVSSTVNCLVAQRIVRRICQSCKVATPVTKEVLADIKKVLGPLYHEGDNLTLYKGKGCQECNSVGYYGRIGIFEVLPISDKIRRMILEKVSAGDINKQAIAEGMITMKQDGYLKVLEGITTIEEVLRVAQK